MLKQHLLFCFFICYFTSILAQTKDNTTSDVPQQKDKTTTTIADNILADMVADSITLANAEVKKKGAISEIISREVLDMKIYTPDTAAMSARILSAIVVVVLSFCCGTSDVVLSFVCAKIDVK